MRSDEMNCQKQKVSVWIVLALLLAWQVGAVTHFWNSPHHLGAPHIVSCDARESGCEPRESDGDPPHGECHFLTLLTAQKTDLSAPIAVSLLFQVDDNPVGALTDLLERDQTELYRLSPSHSPPRFS